jgi:hypothetical protein
MSTPVRIWKALVKAVSYGPGANLKIAQLTKRIDDLVEDVNARSKRINECVKRLEQAEALHNVQLKKIAELENDNEQLLNERDAALAEISELKQHAAVPELTRHDVDDGPYAEPLTLDDLKGFVGDYSARTDHLWLFLSEGDDTRLTEEADIESHYGEWVECAGFNFVGDENLPSGSMVLEDADGNELRRHNPGDRMEWRNK